jgi:hypothetical protein
MVSPDMAIFSTSVKACEHKLLSYSISIYCQSSILFIYYRYSAPGPVWAEIRAQSGDWYGSGMLHPGQILRGSLPLLSPAFRLSNFRHQLPPRLPRREGSQRRKVELWARMLSGNFAEMTTSTHLGIFYMPQIYDMGPTALLPLRRKACWEFFFALKNPTVSAGFEPANLGTKGQHATPRPPKPLILDKGPQIAMDKLWHCVQTRLFIHCVYEYYSLCIYLSFMTV